MFVKKFFFQQIDLFSEESKIKSLQEDLDMTQFMVQTVSGKYVTRKVDFWKKNYQKNITCLA